MAREGPQRLAFTVPLFEPLPSQYYIRVVSDQVGGVFLLRGAATTTAAWQRAASAVAGRQLHAVPLKPAARPLLSPACSLRTVTLQWLGAEQLLAVSFKGLILPERHPPHTGGRALGWQRQHVCMHWRRCLWPCGCV